MGSYVYEKDSTTKSVGDKKEDRAPVVPVRRVALDSHKTKSMPCDKVNQSFSIEKSNDETSESVVKRRKSVSFATENDVFVFDHMDDHFMVFEDDDHSLSEDDLAFPENSGAFPNSANWEDSFTSSTDLFDSFDLSEGLVGQFLSDHSTPLLEKENRCGDATESTTPSDDSSDNSSDPVQIAEVPCVSSSVSDGKESVEPEDVAVILVIDRQHVDAESANRQAAAAAAILTFVGIPYSVVDASDSDTVELRDDLLDISEYGSNYPQVFRYVDGEASFLGGFEEFTEAVGKGQFGEWIADIP